MNRLIILSAARFEAEPLLDELKRLKIDVGFDMFGIGPIAAAWRAVELAKKYANQNILVIGTAGIFSDFQKIQLVKAQSVEWMPTCVRENLGDLIEGQDPHWNTRDKNFLDLSLDLINVHTSPCITTSVPSFKDQKVIENMELYALKPIFEAARGFEAVFAITNSVGPHGRKEWRENLQAAGKITANYLIDHLGKKFEN